VSAAPYQVDMGAGLGAGLWAEPRLQWLVPRAGGSRLSFTFLPRTFTQDPARRRLFTGRNRGLCVVGPGLILLMEEPAAQRPLVPGRGL